MNVHVDESRKQRHIPEINDVCVRRSLSRSDGTDLSVFDNDGSVLHSICGTPVPNPCSLKHGYLRSFLLPKRDCCHQKNEKYKTKFHQLLPSAPALYSCFFLRVPG